MNQFQQINIENILSANEELLWSGKPERGFRITFEDLLKIPFLLFFIGISTTLLNISLNSNDSYKLMIISILLLIGSLYIFINNYILEIFRRKNFLYAITNQRIIIIKKSTFNSLLFENIKLISYEEHPFKYICGSVIFGEPESILGFNHEPFQWYYLLGYKSGMNFKLNKFSFDFIKNYKEVKILIDEELSKINQKSKCQSKKTYLK
jgi:hypothetical protein